MQSVLFMVTMCGEVEVLSGCPVPLALLHSSRGAVRVLPGPEVCVMSDGSRSRSMSSGGPGLKAVRSVICTPLALVSPFILAPFLSCQPPVQARCLLFSAFLFSFRACRVVGCFALG